MAIGDRIKEARKQRGMTQAQLGKAVGVATNTICMYEKNERRVPPELYAAFVSALEIDFRYLLQDYLPPEEDDYILDPQETTMITDMRILNPGTRNDMFTLIHNAASKEKEPSGYIARAHFQEAPYICQDGKWIHPPVQTTMALPDSTFNRQTDFVMNVPDEAMSPELHSDDKLLIAESDSVPEGEIGLFVHEGRLLIRRKTGNLLKAADPRYPDLTMNEDTITLGHLIGSMYHVS